MVVRFHFPDVSEALLWRLGAGGFRRMPLGLGCGVREWAKDSSFDDSGRLARVATMAIFPGMVSEADSEAQAFGERGGHAD
jgi:hypothetical protein